MSDAAPAIVAAFCTRNRPAELVRACASLAASVRASGPPLEAVLVVDGGGLAPDETARVQGALAGAAARVEVLDATGPQSSLFRSRLIALEHARRAGATYVAFLDDDVELLPDYVTRLRATLARLRPAALGGVDALRVPPDALGRAWQRLTGASSGRAERLSASGFGDSQWLWSERAEPFESEFVSGCNMTLSVGVLDALPADARAHFRTYSLAEDLVLAAAAARIGSVIVDPRMRVKHHQSPAGREGRREIGRQLVANALWARRHGVGARSAPALAWSLGWMFARALAGDALKGAPRGKALGMIEGLRRAR